MGKKGLGKFVAGAAIGVGIPIAFITQQLKKSAHSGTSISVRTFLMYAFFSSSCAICSNTIRKMSVRVSGRTLLESVIILLLSHQISDI